MLRFISFIFGKPYEPCKSCETLKQQLDYLRDDNKRLTDTLINILQPKVVEATPQIIEPVAQSSALWSRKRAALEAKDRQEAFILAQKKHIAMPDNPRVTGVITNIEAPQTVEQLEKELGVEEG